MPTTDTNKWFDAAPESQRSILHKLQKLILSSAPGIVEELKWGRPCYSTTMGMFCYLHRSSKYVTIGFHKGALLKDPNNLLEGEGKEMRHVKIADAGDMDQKALLQLINQAIKLK